MDDSTKRELFGPLGDVDPLPPSLLAPTTEQSKTLALLQEISRDFSPLVGHVVLLRTIAERIKRLVNYDVFSVMIWNEDAQLLQSVFSMRYEESIPSRLNVRLHEGSDRRGGRSACAAARERRAQRSALHPLGNRY